MHKVEVKGIRVYGHHGCLPEETVIGQEYAVDIIVYTNFLAAAIEDDLTKTIDYVVVNKIVVDEFKTANKLIENVAWRILNSIKSTYKSAEKVEVKVIKFNPPINGDVNYVAVSIEA